jgi:hypothetical protein
MYVINVDIFNGKRSLFVRDVDKKIVLERHLRKIGKNPISLEAHK